MLFQYVKVCKMKVASVICGKLKEGGGEEAWEEASDDQGQSSFVTTGLKSEFKISRSSDNAMVISTPLL